MQNSGSQLIALRDLITFYMIYVICHIVIHCISILEKYCLYHKCSYQLYPALLTGPT